MVRKVVLWRQIEWANQLNEGKFSGSLFYVLASLSLRMREEREKWLNLIEGKKGKVGINLKEN